MGIKTSAQDGTLSLNKTALALQELAGIDIFEPGSTTEIKDMATLVEELGVKWKELKDAGDDKTMAGLAEAIGGKQQAAVFQSLMNNLDIMKQVQQELGSGMHFQSMEKENAQYVDSIAGKLNTLKETWVGVFNTIFSSDATKGLLDNLIVISEAIANVVTTLDEVGLLTPVLMGLGAMFASKAFTGLPNLFRGGERSVRSFGSTVGVLGGIVPRVAEGLGNFGLMGTSLGVSLLGAGTKVSGFLATASSFIPWAVGGALAVGGLVAAYDHFNESLDKEEQRLNETIDARKQDIASMEEQKGKLQGIQEEYDKLANKPEKTSKEVERLTELTKELAEIRPDLVIGTDGDGNPILSMTGDVQGLIEEMDRATESKKRLLSVEQDESASNAIKQLHGKSYYDVETGIEVKDANAEMNKLESLTTDHISKMSKLEQDRDKLLNDLYNSTGKERQKILKDIEKVNYEIEREQTDFSQNYQQQLDAIKKYSDKIGDGIFGGLEQSSVFKGMDAEMQKQFSSLKSSLDFSDIKTEDELLEVEMALSNLMKAAANGEVDLGKVTKSLENANKEFAKTGDMEKYSQTIEQIINSLEEATGQDFSMLKDVFEGMDTSILKGKDALDEFLRAYGKTKADLDKDDGFAKALANQKRQIEQAIEELNGITGNAELDLELAYSIINNKELPQELRDLVMFELSKNPGNATEILQFAQELLIDISDGNINIDEANEKIKEKFGENTVEITPEILMSDNTKIAGVERAIEQLNEKIGEVPPVVETVIRAEGITAYNSAKEVMEMYNSIPEEVRTTMSTNGLDTLADIINVKNMLNILPPEVVMNLATNFPEVIQGAGSVQEIINALPPSVLMELQTNYPDVVEQSGLLQEAINNIPATKESVVSVKEEVDKSPSGIFDRFFGKNASNMTAIATIETQVQGAEAIDDVSNKIKWLTGGRSGGGSASGGGKRSVESRAIEPLNEMGRAATGGGSASGGGGHTVNISVNVTGQEALSDLQSTLDQFTLGDVQATISIHTAQSAQNLSGLMNRINQTQAALNGLQSKNIAINTALAAQNLSGLLVRVNQYKTAIGSVGDKTVNIHTATAAKNLSGTIAKISSYNGTSISTKKVTVNVSQALSALNSVISKIKSIPSSKTVTVRVNQSGSIPSGNTFRSFASPLANTGNEIQAQTLGIQQQLRNGVDAINGNMPTIHTPKPRLALDSITAAKYDIDLFIALENKLKDINRQLDDLDEKMDKAFGMEKIKYLQQQMDLLEEQKRVQKELIDDMKVQQKQYKDFLNKKGFSFDKDGNITNYEKQLLAMEKEAERLQAIADKDKSTQFQKDQAKEYAEQLANVREILGGYLDLTHNGIPDAEDKYKDMSNAIQDAQDEIVKIKKEQRALVDEAKLHTLTDAYKDLEHELSVINKALEHASGKERLELLDKQLSILQKQKEEIKKQYQLLASQRDFLQDQLAGYGFEFDATGDVTNHAEQLSKLFADGKNIEEINDLLEQYFDIQNDGLPGLEEDYADVNNAIKDLEQEKLKTTADIEAKITEMYKKQIEDRIKAIEKERDAKIDALEKAKKAYNDYRNEVDYKNDYDDQMDVISDLEKQIEIAKKDTSLSGQKKLKELLKQLEEEQKKLDKLVQDKIDEDVNDMFDKEQDRVEEDAENSIKDLEDKFTPEYIAKLVQQALSTGLFTDIEGNVTSLQDAMLDFAEESGELFGVLGDSIRDDLLGNLNIALDTFKDLNNSASDGFGELDKVVGDFSTDARDSFEGIGDSIESGMLDKLQASVEELKKLKGLMEDIDIKEASASVGRMSTPGMGAYSAGETTNVSNTVNFNQPLCIIEGNVDRDALPQLEQKLIELKDSIVDSIVQEMR